MAEVHGDRARVEAGDEVPAGGEAGDEIPVGGEEVGEVSVKGSGEAEVSLAEVGASTMRSASGKAAAEAGAEVWRAPRRSKAAFKRVETSPCILRTLENSTSSKDSHSSVMGSVTLSTVG